MEHYVGGTTSQTCLTLQNTYVEPEGTAVWLRTGDTWLERMVVISGLLRWASH